MSDFRELDLPALSEEELWAEVLRVQELLDHDDKTDARRRRTIAGYAKRVDEELGSRDARMMVVPVRRTSRILH